MNDLYCPNCNRKLNDYEVKKLWCTNCNERFKSINILTEQSLRIIAEINRKTEALNNFLITTGYQFEGYTISKYYNLINSEVVLGTGIFSEADAQFSDLIGCTSSLFEKKLYDAKASATEKIIESAIEIGSNAVIGFRYELFSFSDNIISVSAYGTAVKVTKNEVNNN